MSTFDINILAVREGKSGNGLEEIPGASPRAAEREKPPLLSMKGRYLGCGRPRSPSWSWGWCAAPPQCLGAASAAGRRGEVIGEQVPKTRHWLGSED